MVILSISIHQYLFYQISALDTAILAHQSMGTKRLAHAQVPFLSLFHYTNQQKTAMSVSLFHPMDAVSVLLLSSNKVNIKTAAFHLYSIPVSHHKNCLVFIPSYKSAEPVCAVSLFYTESVCAVSLFYTESVFAVSLFYTESVCSIDTKRAVLCSTLSPTHQREKHTG